MTDRLTTCKHCGSHFCYEIYHESIISWKCFNCGFESNSNFINNTEVVNIFEDKLPSLYKDIKYLDDDGFVWYPMIINNPYKGIIFPDGTSKDKWEWCYAPAVEIPLNDRNVPDPNKPGEFMTHKIDMKSSKRYKPNEFFLALEDAKLI